MSQGYQKQLTFSSENHILTTANCFTCDSREVLYDNRTRGRGKACIMAANAETALSRVVYRHPSGGQACVVTCHPTRPVIAFIKELEHPEINGKYAAWCRQGGMLDLETGEYSNIDARDMYSPFTPGAMRGGSHVHVFAPDGGWMSNTYEDGVLAALGLEHDSAQGDANLRNVEINIFGRPVNVPEGIGNHSGVAFSFAAARLHSDPVPGSDQIHTAVEEGAIGKNGYLRADGSRQNRAVACLGEVVDRDGDLVPEIFVIDIPDEIVEGDGPLCGTATRRPLPPKGTTQRRLTHLCEKRFKGVGGARHWLRSTPDGKYILFLAPDSNGVVQAWAVPTLGGEPKAVTALTDSITSAFSLSPDGTKMAYFSGERLLETALADGRTEVLLEPDSYPSEREPVVYSPDGSRIVYQRRVPSSDGQSYSQLFTFNFA
ncbi:MAG: DUF3748 domain-containing protein [Clostridia bacterium]|nr:DUF3748 domain-containing protein [Clostridia bacterium]